MVSDLEPLGIYERGVIGVYRFCFVVVPAGLHTSCAAEVDLKLRVLSPPDAGIIVMATIPSIHDAGDASRLWCVLSKH